jgi:hypothetical protein
MPVSNRSSSATPQLLFVYRERRGGDAVIVRECLNHWLRRYGEPFYVGLQSYRGLFFQPPGNLLRWLFSPETLNELPRPLWAVAVAPAVSFSDGNRPYMARRDLSRATVAGVFDSIQPPVYRLMLIEPVA